MTSAAPAAPAADQTGHEALIVYCQALALFSAAGTTAAGTGMLSVAGGSWIPGIGNGAFRTDDTADPIDVLRQADAFFADRERGYSMKVRDTDVDADLWATCVAQEMITFGEPAPQMVRHQRLGQPSPPAGVTLRAVDDAAGVLDFVAVCSEAYATYGIPTDVHASLFNPPALVLAHPSTTIVVASREGRALATALLFMHDGVGSVQWVGTVSDARRLGLGQLVTEWVTNAAFDRGATVCTLQASPMGAPLYEALGYETIYHYQDFTRWFEKSAQRDRHPSPIG
ncbi:MAG TPA: GNAT family N-acetyltransferase [Acidimicrobiales bacterium]|nr:GNAT family N-acetyltransferase [Acidimicrobiales bacterium]